IAEIRGLHLPVSERLLDRFDQDRRQAAVVDPFPRLVAHELRGDGRLRPEHDDAAGRVQLLLNVVVEVLADRNVPIPPDRPAARLERGCHEPRACFVLARVTQEDVRHALVYGSMPSIIASSKSQLDPPLTKRTTVSAFTPEASVPSTSRIAESP